MLFFILYVSVKIVVLRARDDVFALLSFSCPPIHGTDAGYGYAGTLAGRRTDVSNNTEGEAL